MKILVLSDNHGRYALVQELLTQWRSKVDYIFHTGDSEFPADDPIWDLVDGVVSGNMDYDPQYLRELEVETPNGKVILLHGHRHGVNRSNQQIMDLAKEKEASFLFHGHTHRLYASYYEGILYVNPGSLHRSRGEHPEKTFSVIDSQPDSIEVTYYDDENQKLDHLTQVFEKE